MSDSDDTDLLLLIPPDFFLVPSSDLDDEVSTDNFVLNDFQPIEQGVVSKLIYHVNELESRISIIENFDTSRQSGVDSYSLSVELPVSNVHVLTDKQTCENLKFKSMSNQSHPLSGSIDNIQAGNYLKNRNEFVSPPRYRQPFSLPSTPCYDILNKIDYLPSRLNFNENNLDELNNRPINIHSDVNKFITENPNSLSKNNHEINSGNTIHTGYQLLNTDSQVRTEQKELLGEIDQYLGEVERHGGIFQNKKDSLNFKSLTVSSQEPNVDSTDLKQSFVSMSKKDNTTTHLDLPEVDRLLKEIESTQNEIEQKIKLHSPPKRISTNTFNLNSHIRENRTVGVSTPDSGFATKENDDKSDNTFGRRSIRCGYSPRSRKKLDMNYKFKTLDKQLNLSSNYMLQDNQLKKLCMNSSNENDLVSVQNDSLKNIHGIEPLNDNERQFHSAQTTENIGEAKLSTYNSGTKQGVRQSNEQSDGPKQLSGTKEFAYRSGLDKQPTVESNKITHEKQGASNLLSLTDLWNKEPTFYSDDPNKLRQKLEEEKYRRQHCEEMIKNLQSRVLEEQEKLAVAVRVDEEKDKAIIQLTDAWRKLVKHWGELEDQRHGLAQQLQIEQDMSRTKLEEMAKKVNRWETEVSQALDLAAGYKEKFEDMRKEKDALKLNLKTRIEEAEKQIEELCNQNEKFVKQRNQMKEEVEEHRKKTMEDKQILEDTQKQLEQLEAKFTQSEAEINVLKEQKQALSVKLKDEKAHASALEQQKVKLQQMLEESKKTEKASKDEARMFTERMEVARTELRALYQGQLEAVVKEKLREFQNQLDTAEAALKAELLTREKAWAEKTNNQCRMLSEKHKSELQQVHVQYKEELRSWRMRLIEYERLKSLMESKLQEESNRRSEIAQKLHAVMENQWKQALNIITNSNSVSSENNESQSRSNIHLDMKNFQSQGSSVASGVRNDDIPFEEEGRATYRLADAPQQDQLKKYIQMLLDRSPGNLESTWRTPVTENPLPSPGSSIGGRWSAFMPFQDDRKINCEEQGNKPNGSAQSNKPPWK